MGQDRTALLIGVKPNKKLDRFLKSDTSNAILERSNFRWEWSDDGKMFGIPFAVAYDPPMGCAELALPVRLEDFGRSKLKAAYNRALRQWSRLEMLFRKHGQDLGSPEIFIGEVETA